MVAYVTPAEKNGGILQFSITMLRETMKLKEAVLFVPDSVEKECSQGLCQNTIIYKKIKTINGNNSGIKELADTIASKGPEAVVFLEDSLLMQQLNYIITKKGIKTAVVVHDVIRHPYRSLKPRAIIVDILRRMWLRKTVKQDNAILLLSNNSKELLKKSYKRSKAKLVVMNLGAHVPNASSNKPQEIPQIDNYYLFFGRIDKYKGIADLCEAYVALPDEFKLTHKLVIAGNGILSDKEKELINQDNNIILLNRFIEDGEMVWLYQNANTVVLPYIEASQSGVLPIAYYYNKPVIVSNQQGLLENIEYGKTGYSYKTLKELGEHMQKIVCVELSDNIRSYYERKFNWQKNIDRMLEEI